MLNRIALVGVFVFMVADVTFGQNGPAAFPQGGASTYNGPQAITVSPVIPQNPYAGSTPSGQPSPEVLELTLFDAVSRGLKQNLGPLLTSSSIRSARGQKAAEMSNILPNISAAADENLRAIDLATFGFRFSFPGFTIPNIIGPFGYFDTRVYLSQSLLNLQDITRTHSANENLKSAQYTYKDARDQVVQAVGANYFSTVAAMARVETAQAQVNTAQALFQQASDQLKAGVSPSIDALRAQVELQTRQQQLISARNDLQKQKLVLARIIGLPLGQQFDVTTKAQFEPLNGPTLDEALTRAYASRSDLQAAMAQLRAAELSRKAATEEHYPTLDFDGDYGGTGITPGHLYGTYDLAGTLRVPIFMGNRAHADALQADAAVAQSRAEVENIRGQIDQDVRNAFLDLQSASDQVKVAESNVDLAGQTLVQAQDRFKAGVTDNIEVVQAQESVASANESYIDSLYAFNVAKISLARAVGLAEDNMKQFFKGY